MDSSLVNCVIVVLVVFMQSKSPLSLRFFFSGWFLGRPLLLYQNWFFSCNFLLSIFILQIEITELDDFAQVAFHGYKSLNRIQSRIFQTVYHTNENILVSMYILCLREHFEFLYNFNELYMVFLKIKNSPL